MASNPIQRRARQSFLVGFLLALIIMAFVVAFLIFQINKLNTEMETAEVSEQTVYMLNTTVSSGQEITPDMFTMTTLTSTDLNTSMYVTSDYFYIYDEDGNLQEDVTYIAKVDIAAGTLITEEMVERSDYQTSDDDRITEYNMIELPSQLLAGDYIDVRISYPSGENYVILSKKYVEQTTATGVWMKMSELETLMMQSAIVENYTITGSKIYATVYTEPGMQEAAEVTYPVNSSVLLTIETDPNVLDEAYNELVEKYNSTFTDSSQSTYNTYSYNRSIIEGYLSDVTDDEKASLVESGNEEESESISEARESYLDSLESSSVEGATY